MRRSLRTARFAVMLVGGALVACRHLGDGAFPDPRLEPGDDPATGAIVSVSSRLASSESAARLDAEQRVRDYCHGPFVVVSEEVQPLAQMGGGPPLSPSVRPDDPLVDPRRPPSVGVALTAEHTLRFRCAAP